MVPDHYSIVAKARPYLSTDHGEGIFGSGKAELLLAIERLGSLRKAAAELERSYRQAWGDINNAEKYLGFPLVSRSRGGPQGGTMELTGQGRKFLHAWQQHSKSIADAVDASFKKYIFPVINNHQEVPDEHQ